MSYDTDGDGSLSLIEFQVALEADPFLMAQFSAISAVPVRTSSPLSLRMTTTVLIYDV